MNYVSKWEIGCSAEQRGEAVKSVAGSTDL